MMLGRVTTIVSMITYDIWSLGDIKLLSLRSSSQD